MPTWLTKLRSLLPLPPLLLSLDIRAACETELVAHPCTPRQCLPLLRLALLLGRICRLPRTSCRRWGFVWQHHLLQRQH